MARTPWLVNGRGERLRDVLCCFDQFALEVSGCVHTYITCERTNETAEASFSYLPNVASSCKARRAGSRGRTGYAARKSPSPPSVPYRQCKERKEGER